MFFLPSTSANTPLALCGGGSLYILLYIIVIYQVYHVQRHTRASDAPYSTIANNSPICHNLSKVIKIVGEQAPAGSCTMR